MQKMDAGSSYEYMLVHLALPGRNGTVSAGSDVASEPIHALGTPYGRGMGLLSHPQRLPSARTALRRTLGRAPVRADVEGAIAGPHHDHVASLRLPTCLVSALGDTEHDS